MCNDIIHRCDGSAREHELFFSRCRFISRLHGSVLCCSFSHSSTGNPSTLQPFNPSTLQPFNPSTLQPFNPPNPSNSNLLKPSLKISHHQPAWHGSAICRDGSLHSRTSFARRSASMPPEDHLGNSSAMTVLTSPPWFRRRTQVALPRAWQPWL